MTAAHAFHSLLSRMSENEMGQGTWSSLALLLLHWYCCHIVQLLVRQAGREALQQEGAGIGTGKIVETQGTRGQVAATALTAEGQGRGLQLLAACTD